MERHRHCIRGALRHSCFVDRESESNGPTCVFVKSNVPLSTDVAAVVTVPACVILSRMEHGHFVTLAIEFESLQKEIERTNDPALRNALLGELASKLRELDEMAKSAIRQLAREGASSNERVIEMPRKTGSN